MKKTHTLLVVVIVALVSAAAGYYFATRTPAAPFIDAASKGSSPDVAGVPLPSTEGLSIYKSPAYHFSVQYPAALGQVTDHPVEGGGHIVTFESGQKGGD